MLSQVSIFFLITALVATGALGALAWWLTQLAADSPERIVGELRLSQVGAIVLAFNAALQAGLAAALEQTPGAAADVAIAGMFAGVALLAQLREPRQALALLAGAFAAHALIDIAHRPGMLPVLAPEWLAVGGAACDLILAALLFIPVVRR